MSFDKKSLNTDSNEGSVTEGTYLTSILSVVNGFCKVNLEVKLTKSFYSKDSLLPINAKVNNDYCMQQKSLNTDISKSDEYIENISQSNNSSNDEFQIYSRPSYSASVLNNDKKLNLVSRVKEQSTSNNVITEPSGLESLHTNQNPFKDYNISQDNNEDLEIGFKQRVNINIYIIIIVDMIIIILLLFNYCYYRNIEINGC